MMKLKHKIFISIGLIASLIGNVQAAEDWVAEEIFKQIAELKRDNNLLRKELESLKTQLASLQAKKQPKRISSVSLDDDYRMIDENKQPKVAIVEFSDFECPFCRRHIKQTMPRLKQKYIDSGKVQYVMRDFPLSFHRNAKSAAVAANCAGEQGLYWQMHTELFHSKQAKGQALYVALADKLQLDKKQFENCLQDPKQVKEIDADFSYGTSIGVSGTPAFFVGKLQDGKIVDAQFISGAQSFERFSSVLDPLLN